MASMNGLAYRPDVDGLRALAVLAVLFFHLGFPAFEGGYVGVDVFFVISGFLITRLIRGQVERGEFTFTGFYIRRVRRLFPALFVTGALTLVAAALLFSPQHLARLGGSLVAAVLSVSNIYFWRESGYFDTDALFKPLLHTWSLGVEEQFYLVWPATLVFLLARPGRATAPVFILVSGVLGLGATEWVFGISPEAAFFLAPFRVAEFACGALLVWLPEAAPRHNASREVFLAGGLALIAWSVLTFSDNTRFPGLSALVPALGASLAILGGRARITGRLLSNPGCVYVGLISYSLYLVHWPLYVFHRYLTFEEPTVAERWLLIGVSVVLAMLMHRYVETPFLRGNREGALPPGRFARATALCTVILVLPAAYAYVSKGWTWRLDGMTVSASSERGFEERTFGGESCQPPTCATRVGATRAYAIGDSHVQHYFGGLRQVLLEQRFEFFHTSACQFWSTNVQSVRGGVIDPLCTEARSLGFEAIRGHPAAVLVSQSWLRTVGHPLMDLQTGHTWSFRKRPASEAAGFIVGQLRSLKASLGVGTIIVLGAVPRFGNGSPYVCANRLPWLHTPESCLGQPRDGKGLRRARGFNTAMRAAIGAAGDDGIHWLDPFEALCDETQCWNFEGSEPLYSDRGHLSVWGARRVVAHFAARIEELLVHPVPSERR